MENINELPKPVRERIEELKEKTPLNEEELAFLKSRQDYLTDEEKERLFQEPTEEVVEAPKKRGRKKATTE